MIALAAMLAAGTPAAATPAPGLETALAAALRGCEQWIVHPESWENGVGPFVAAVGLGDRMGLVDSVDEVVLPPEELRAGNRYWRINATLEAGYYLVVSDQLPMCHITGGGNADLQPAVEAVLASPDFASHWQDVASQSDGTMASTGYRNRAVPDLKLIVSRASAAGGRRGSVQVLATAVYQPETAGPPAAP